MGVYTETDAAALHEWIINKLQKDVGEQLHPGDERRMFAESLTGLFVAVFNTMDDVAKQNMLRYAREDILDAYGEGSNCFRLKAEKAATTLRFSMNSVYTTDIKIPAGTRAATEDGHCFETEEDAVIEKEKLYVEVKARAVKGGEEYNGFLPDTVTVMVDLLSYVDGVTNKTGTDGGTDEEKDDDYRERIRLSLTRFSTAGPQNAWKYWALSADSGISDAYIKNPSANEIVILIIMNDGKLPDNETLKKVEQAVSADDVRPLGDHVTVKTPETALYDITVKYYVTSENEKTAAEAIESKKYIDSTGTERTGAIETYRLWQDTVIARDINPDKLKSLIMNPAGDGSIPGADRVEITSPVYTELTGDTVAHFSGNLTVTHVVKDDD